MEDSKPEVADQEEDLFGQGLAIEALKFETEAVGEIISSTVHEDRFYFTVNRFVHKLVLLQGVMDSKVRVTLDGLVLFDGEEKGFFESIFTDKTFHFQHEMKQYGLMLQIVRTEEVVDLLINGNSFMKMLQVTEQRKKQEKRERTKENQLAASALFQSVVATAPSRQTSE